MLAAGTSRPSGALRTSQACKLRMRPESSGAWIDYRHGPGTRATAGSRIGRQPGRQLVLDQPAGAGKVVSILPSASQTEQKRKNKDNSKRKEVPATNQLEKVMGKYFQALGPRGGGEGKTAWVHRHQAVACGHGCRPK